MRIQYQRFFGAPYKIRTCDPRFRKPMLYPTELRAQFNYSHYLSQNMSVCFLYSIYISTNLSVKRQMSDKLFSCENSSTVTSLKNWVKFLVANDSESQHLAVFSRQLPAAGFAGSGFQRRLIWVSTLNLFLEFDSGNLKRGPTAFPFIAL